MSVQTEINRIETAKAAIGTAIAGKGVAVPSGTKLDGMAALIEDIEQGSDPVLQSKTVSPTTSAQTVKPDSGYDALSQVTVNAMPTATQATPSISVSSGGLITASATQTAGYVAAGTKSATKQLTVQAAQTITPGTSNKTIASGRYLTGTQTIKGDANLKAENIAKGVSIFGVTGTHEGGEDVSAETAEYTELLTDLETAIDALPEAGGGGGGGGSVETCTVIIGGGDMFFPNLFGYAYMTLDDNGQIVSKTATFVSIDAPHEITCLVNSIFWIKDGSGGGPGFPDMLQFTGCELVKYFNGDASLLVKLTCGAGETASIR